jgi:hypothetical protein
MIRLGISTQEVHGMVWVPLVTTHQHPDAFVPKAAPPPPPISQVKACKVSKRAASSVLRAAKKRGAQFPFPVFFMYDIDISLGLGGSTCKGVMEVGLVGVRCSRLPSLSQIVLQM